MRPMTSFMLHLPVLACCVLGALSVLVSSQEISENSHNSLITSSLIQTSSTGTTGSSDASLTPLRQSSRSLLQLRHCAAQACPPYLCCSSSFGCGLGSACLTDCLSGPCETAGNTVTSNSVTGNSAAGTGNTVDGATADGSTTGGGGNPRGPRLQPPVCCTAAACDIAPIMCGSGCISGPCFPRDYVRSRVAELRNRRNSSSNRGIGAGSSGSERNSGMGNGTSNSSSGSNSSSNFASSSVTGGNNVTGSINVTSGGNLSTGSSNGSRNEASSSTNNDTDNSRSSDNDSDSSGSSVGTVSVGVLAIVVVGSVFSSLFLLLAIFLCLRHQKKQRERREHNEEERQGGSSTRERGRFWQKPSQRWWQWARNRTIHADPETASQQHNNHASRNKISLTLASSPSDAPRRFTFAQLRSATDGFSQANKIGEGAFGTVYRSLAIPDADLRRATSASRRGKDAAASGKGVEDEQRIEELWAVKRAKRGSMGPGGAFEREVRTIWRLNHRSLVSLIGWCAEQGEQLLVYEFVPNGNLYEALHDLSRPPLSFFQRVHIALGIARALHYIHEQARDRMLHRDVKSLNILLTAELQPKLSDFGLSRMLEGGEASFFTHGLSGTRGYLDPEFITTHRASTKTDVYSFGVVLLELLTGQRPLLYVSPPAVAAAPQPAHTFVGEDHSAITAAHTTAPPSCRPRSAVVLSTTLPCNNSSAALNITWPQETCEALSEIVPAEDQIFQIPVGAHARAASTKLLLEDPSLGASSNQSFGVTTLADWARRVLSHGHLADIVDPRMPRQQPEFPPQLAEIADVAVSCTDPIGYHRPGMGSVCSRLEAILHSLTPTPTMPHHHPLYQLTSLPATAPSTGVTSTVAALSGEECGRSGAYSTDDQICQGSSNSSGRSSCGSAVYVSPSAHAKFQGLGVNHEMGGLGVNYEMGPGMGSSSMHSSGQGSSSCGSSIGSTAPLNP
ncbi:unnamed protein product [Closterium sp. NIES-54]